MPKSLSPNDLTPGFPQTAKLKHEIWLTFLCETIILYFTPSSGGNPVCSIKDTHVQYFLLNKSVNGKESGNGTVSYLRCVCSRLALELLNLADFFFFFFTLLFLRFFFSLHHNSDSHAQMRTVSLKLETAFR